MELRSHGTREGTYDVDGQDRRRLVGVEPRKERSLEEDRIPSLYSILGVWVGLIIFLLRCQFDKSTNWRTFFLFLAFLLD